MRMKNGWAYSLRAAAFAAVLALSGTSLAQSAISEAPETVGAPVVTAAPPEPVEITSDPAAAAEIAPVAPARLAPDPLIGQPINGQIAFQQQFSPVGQQAKVMMDWVLTPVITGISLLVIALLGWAIFRYRASRNPVASKTTHNVTIEMIWTLAPAIILLFMAFPSFKLLANQYSPPKADITIKVIGSQWYWTYEYPDFGGISFDSLMLSEEDAKAEGVPYLLDVDNRIVVPTGATVKLLVTATDVIHSFAVPSFWVKMDAVPGKINETWFRVERPGVYYGQCSEICGTRHGFMPIAVEVREPEEFRQWVRAQQAEEGIEPTGPGIAVASASDADANETAATAEDQTNQLASADAADA